jgi:Tfp pilus assembly protein FimV
LIRFACRYSLPVLMLAFSGGVSAVGLGDLRGQPVLGQRIQLEIDLLGAEKQKLDAGCFRLIQPSGSSDLPWIKKASFSVRKGAQPVLEIRSDVPLREPIVQLAVQLTCGHELSREYVLMASPLKGRDVPVAEPVPAEIALPPGRAPVRRPVKVRSEPVAVDEAPARLPVRRTEKRPSASKLPDRLMLSGEGFMAEPSLRLATELFRGEPRPRRRSARYCASSSGC